MIEIEKEISDYVTRPPYASTPFSLAWVAEMVARRYPGDIVEIGAGDGTTTKELLKVAKRFGKKVIVIDPYSLGWEDMPHSYGPGGGYTKEKLIANVDSVDGHDNFELIEQSSQDVAPDTMWRRGNICFAFVDGIQNKQAVVNDLYLMSKSTVIAVDDYKRLTELSQVAPAVDEYLYANSDHYRLVVDRATVRSRAFLINEDRCKKYANR